jgi:hypothetical protein
MEVLLVGYLVKYCVFGARDCFNVLSFCSSSGIVLLAVLARRLMPGLD